MLRWSGLTAFALLTACAPEPSGAGPEVLRLEGPTMGTSWQVQIALTGLAEDLRARLVDTLGGKIDAILRKVNAEMSTYLADSEISRFGASRSTDWFPVSKDFALVVQRAMEISKQSGGAFDVTIAPLVELWGFGPQEQRDVPSEEAIARARAKTGMQHLELRLDPPALRKRIPELSMDLSAIAKGHGVDRVAELLDSYAFGWWVEIGGEVRTRGDKGLGQPWRVAIERPREQGREAHLVVPIRDEAVATSGDYRNFIRVAKERRSHILDPRSGRSVAPELAQVSVWASDCASADAWATALMVLGADKAMQTALAQRLQVLMLVRSGDADGGLMELRSPAFEERQLVAPQSGGAARK